MALTFTVPEHQELEAILGEHIPTAKDAIKYVGARCSLLVNGMRVDIEPDLLDRLSERAFEMPIHEYIQELVRKAIMVDLGLD